VTTYYGIAASLTGPMNGARGRKRKNVPLDLVVLHLWVSPEDGPWRYLKHLATPNLPGVSGRVFQSKHPNGAWLWESQSGGQTTDTRFAKRWTGRPGIVYRSKAAPYVLVPFVSDTPWTYGAGYHGVAGVDGNPYWACDPEMYSVNANPPVNDRAVSFCLPGRYQTRDQWLNDGNSRQFIRSAAAAIVWAHQRWDIPLVRLDAKALKAGGRGYTDHATVNAVWRMSNHGDVGAAFPWDVLADDIDLIVNGDDMARFVQVWEGTYPQFAPADPAYFIDRGGVLEHATSAERVKTLTDGGSVRTSNGVAFPIWRWTLDAYRLDGALPADCKITAEEFHQ